MKTIYTYILTAVCLLCLAACNPEEYGDRKESTPVIETASISPTSFFFGDSITIKAKISDPSTVLVALDYVVIANNRTITSGSIVLSGSESEVAEPILVPLLNNQADDAPVTVVLTAKNVLKGEASQTITGLTGKRKAYSQLYLVNSIGNVVKLTSLADSKDKFEAKGLTLATTFNYQIAERITSDGQIDYSGAVWGNVNGRLATIDSKGEAAFAEVLGSIYTNAVTFDCMSFDIQFNGEKTLPSNYVALGYIPLAAFTGVSINGEECYQYNLHLETNHEYTLIGSLASNQVVCNIDFFERTATDKVKFLGQTGSYTLTYNAYRKFILVSVPSPSLPDYLLMTGVGIGYPSKVGDINRAHSSWGFDNAMQYILFRKVADNVFQGTLNIGENADFKTYENGGWGGEKRLDAFKTITGEQILKGDNNWKANDKLDPNAFYRITIDLNTKNLNITKVTI